MVSPPGASRVQSEDILIGNRWDTTIAFISREMPTMPETYVDALMVDDGMDERTFFALNGCPYAFMKAMRQFAKAAAVLKQMLPEDGSSEMQQVDELVEYLRKWENEYTTSIEEVQASDEDPDDRMDRFHCCEAWRSAVLLYSRRVFCTHQDPAGLRVIQHLSRTVLDHIRCIRVTQMMQKQVLLPVFLAAVETADEDSRCFVRQYCKHWSTTARYSQFETALTLIENIWVSYEVNDRADYWWGCDIGSHMWSGEHDGGPGLEQELLLG